MFLSSFDLFKDVNLSGFVVLASSNRTVKKSSALSSILMP